MGAEVGGGEQNQQRQHLTDCEKQLKPPNDAKNVKKSVFSKQNEFHSRRSFVFKTFLKFFFRVHFIHSAAISQKCAAKGFDGRIKGPPLQCNQ